MFDDSRLRKLKTLAPESIFQRLPNLKPHSKLLIHKTPNNQSKEIFSEFSLLNQISIAISKPPKFPLNQRPFQYKSSGTSQVKTRSVSFIDFSEALTTVARLSRIEEQTGAACLGVLKKLAHVNDFTMSNTTKNLPNSVGIQGNHVRRIAGSVPLSKRRKIISIFNYPNLRFDGFGGEIKINTLEKPSLLQREPEKTARIENSIHIDKIVSQSIDEKGIDSIKKNPFFNEKDLVMKENNIMEPQKNVIRVKQNKEKTKKSITPCKMYKQTQNKIKFKKSISLHQNTIPVCKSENIKKNIDLRIHNDFLEEKNMIEPWAIQETLPEEN